MMGNMVAAEMMQQQIVADEMIMAGGVRDFYKRFPFKNHSNLLKFVLLIKGMGMGMGYGMNPIVRQEVLAAELGMVSKT